MGQKANPIGMRIGIIKAWDSIWWNEKKLGAWVVEDEKIRRYIFKYFRKAEIARVTIERNPGVLKLVIYTGKPALLIGQKGSEIDLLKKNILKIITDKTTKIDSKIEEIRNITSSAQILATNLALQVERGFPYKRAMKKVIADTLKDGIKGVKIKISGRLGGAEMARSEWYSEGRIPTQTLRADIDYALACAQTQYGSIGLKVWIFKNEIIEKNPLKKALLFKESGKHSSPGFNKKRTIDKKSGQREKSNLSN